MPCGESILPAPGEGRDDCPGEWGRGKGGEVYVNEGPSLRGEGAQT